MNMHGVYAHRVIFYLLCKWMAEWIVPQTRRSLLPAPHDECGAQNRACCAGSQHALQSTPACPTTHTHTERLKNKDTVSQYNIHTYNYKLRQVFLASHWTNCSLCLRWSLCLSSSICPSPVQTPPPNMSWALCSSHPCTAGHDTLRTKENMYIASIKYLV